MQSSPRILNEDRIQEIMDGRPEWIIRYMIKMHQHAADHYEDMAELLREQLIQEMM